MRALHLLRLCAQHAAPGPADNSRKKLVEALEDRLTKADRKGNMYQERYQQVSDRLPLCLCVSLGLAWLRCCKLAWYGVIACTSLRCRGLIGPVLAAPSSPCPRLVRTQATKTIKSLKDGIAALFRKIGCEGTPAGRPSFIIRVIILLGRCSLLVYLLAVGLRC